MGKSCGDGLQELAEAGFPCPNEGHSFAGAEQATEFLCFRCLPDRARKKGFDMRLSTWRRRGGRRLGGRRLGVGLLAAAALLASAGCAGNPGPQDIANHGPPSPGSAREFISKAVDLVYFSTDSTDLSPESQQTLASQARWLKQYAHHAITIEGHADERGTREYNIALGEKRAHAVRAFLVQQGVNTTRIRTVSYGKERPVAICNDISCWSQNRRAQTKLNGGHGAGS